MGMNVTASGGFIATYSVSGAVLESRILKRAHNAMDFVVASPCIHFFMQGSYFIACPYYWPKNPLGSD